MTSKTAAAISEHFSKSSLVVEETHHLTVGFDTVMDSELPQAKVTYDEEKFLVELNVGDYAPEELFVKTEGDVLSISAKRETRSSHGVKRSGGGGVVSKQFEQRFSLPPGVRADSVSSSLSSSGVLSVSAPRFVAKKTLPLTGFRTTRGSLEELVPPKEENSPSRLPKIFYDDRLFRIELDCGPHRPDDLNVTVEDGDTIVITMKREAKEPDGTSRSRVIEQKFSLPSGTRPETVRSSLGRDGVLTISASRDVTGPLVSTVERMTDRVLSPNSWGDDFRTKSSLANDNNGMSRVVVENNVYKILVNVEGFKAEDLVVKTVGGMVRVEARSEKTEDGRTYSSRNFSQTFSLPEGADPEKVTSSLSKDGTLTVFLPLPRPISESKGHERLVHISRS